MRVTSLLRSLNSLGMTLASLFPAGLDFSAAC
jgi:hypothetical protein